MMYLQRGSRFHHQSGLGTQAFSDQVMMYRRGGQQGRDGHMICIHSTIGQYQYVVTFMYCLFRFHAKIPQGRFHPFRAIYSRIDHTQRAGVECTG